MTPWKAPRRLLDALAAPHGVDRYLELARPVSSLGETQAEIVQASQKGLRSVTLTLRPSERFEGFSAGQFVNVTVEIDGVRETRCYSLACAEQTVGEIELTVKAHPAGKVSRYLNDHAHPGMVIGLSQAEGKFVLPEPRPRRVLLISGGSGITPVMSLLRTLRAERYRGEVTFLHYTRTERHVPYLDELRTIAEAARNVSVAVICTRGRGGSGDGLRRGEHAHLSRGQLRRLAPDYEDGHAYVCGPPSLIAATQRLWRNESIHPEPRVESFRPPRATLGRSKRQGEVRFTRSGKQGVSDGGCLLEQAERAGLSPRFGCRMGICRMCTTHKVSGLVRNVLSGELSSAAEEDIQICVSTPAGDVELAL